MTFPSIWWHWILLGFFVHIGWWFWGVVVDLLSMLFNKKPSA